MLRHVAKHIDELNRLGVYVETKVVEGRAAQEAKAMGIRNTPTLDFGGRKFVGADAITKVLTPPSRGVDRPPLNVANSEEYIMNYQQRIIASGEEEEQEDFGMTLQQKMAAFQKRRPEMLGVDPKAALSGGRKLPPPKQTQSSFSSDDDFRSAAGLDNLEPTPASGYNAADDGLLLLEDYYNAEADRSGRHLTRGRRPIPQY